MHVDHLMQSWEASEPPSKATARWIAGFPLRERAKLERADLIEKSEASKERTRKRDNPLLIDSGRSWIGIFPTDWLTSIEHW